MNVLPPHLITARRIPEMGLDKALACSTASKDRAEALVAQMTTSEKLSLVTTSFPTLASKFPNLSTEAMRADSIPSAGYNRGVPRLGIPPLRQTDASLGVANPMHHRDGDTATALPSALATAASFDPALAWESSAAIGAEARAKGFNMLLAGGVNLTRDPWAGRNFEYLGEDALLAGRMAGASIAGVQSNGVASTVKHFVLNCQETGRMVLDARIDLAALRESDLLAFRIAIEDGRPASVMGAYNRINGLYASENAFLLNQVLKEEWGYPGWVMSDWGAVHSTEDSVLAGLDQESGIELDQWLNGAVFYTDRLEAALQEGRIPLSRLDDMVTRILTGLIDSGVMEDRSPQPYDEVAKNAIEVAQRVAEAGSVLLRNENDLLPLSLDVRRILIIGGHADVGVLSGGGSSQVQSHGGAALEVPLIEGEAAWFSRVTYHASSPLRAISDVVPHAEVRYADGKNPSVAAKLAREVEVAIVFATQWHTEAMDAESLSLPDGQDALIEAVAAANPRTIVVLESGGPVRMPWIYRVPAVLEAWYPGQRGGEAIARLLFGLVSPSGRLPITFPLSEDQAPRPSPPGLDKLRARDVARSMGDLDAKIMPFAVGYAEGANVGYRWYEISGQEPLFPFGHGLSYTNFQYEGLTVESGALPAVSIDVVNVGKRDGTDVPQIYVRAADAAGEVAWRLAGFARVFLSKGERKRVRILLEPRCFAKWDVKAQGWHIDTDPLPVAVGRSSRDHVLTGSIHWNLRDIDPNPHPNTEALTKA